MLRLSLVVAVALLSAGAAAIGEASVPWRLVADVPLGGRSPRFDYQSLDARAGRLYVAHQGDGTIVVVDLAHRRVIKRIGGVAGVHGVLAVPALQRLYATATATHELVVLDTRSDRVVARHRAGVVPDGIAYDPVGHMIYVSDERPAGALIVADARSGRTVSTIPLGGSAGNVQYDPGRRTILVGVETRDELAIVDPVRRQIARRVPVGGCDANHSLLVAPAARLLVVGCSRNGRLVVLDADSYRRLGTVSGAGHVDVLALDPTRGVAYATAEDGVITSVRLRPGLPPTLLGRTRVPRAHTVAVDPRTHLVYLPLGRTAGRSVLRVLAPARR